MSQSGTGRPWIIAWVLSIGWAFRDFSRTATTSPGRTWYEGMFTVRPLTLKWRWLTSWRASGREAAKPSR